MYTDAKLRETLRDRETERERSSLIITLGLANVLYAIALLYEC